MIISFQRIWYHVATKRQISNHNMMSYHIKHNSEDNCNTVETKLHRNNYSYIVEKEQLSQPHNEIMKSDNHINIYRKTANGKESSKHNNSTKESLNTTLRKHCKYTCIYNSDMHNNNKRTIFTGYCLGTCVSRSLVGKKQFEAYC